MENNIITIIIFILFFADFFITTFTFRYQRTTLNISRTILGVADANLQASLSPTWVGALSIISLLFKVILAILIYYELPLICPLIYILYAIFGTAINDLFSTFPSYNYCFNIVKIKKNDKKQK
jgi:hypothetical protein